MDCETKSPLNRPTSLFGKSLPDNNFVDLFEEKPGGPIPLQNTSHAIMAQRHEPAVSLDLFGRRNPMGLKKPKMHKPNPPIAGRCVGVG